MNINIAKSAIVTVACPVANATIKSVIATAGTAHRNLRLDRKNGSDQVGLTNSTTPKTTHNAEISQVARAIAELFGKTEYPSQANASAPHKSDANVNETNAFFTCQNYLIVHNILLPVATLTVDCNAYLDSTGIVDEDTILLKLAEYSSIRVGSMLLPAVR